MKQIHLQMYSIIWGVNGQCAFYLYMFLVKFLIKTHTPREGTYIYLGLIHVDTWQKPTQYCKAIIFQLKINN